MRLVILHLLLMFSLSEALMWGRIKDKISGFHEEAKTFFGDDNPTTTEPPPLCSQSIIEQAAKWRQLEEIASRYADMDILGDRSKRSLQNEDFSKFLEDIMEWFDNINEDMQDSMDEMEASMDKVKEEFGREFDWDAPTRGYFSKFKRKQFRDKSQEGMSATTTYTTTTTTDTTTDTNTVVTTPSEAMPTPEPYETPDYIELCKTEDYEARWYNGTVYVSTTVIDFSQQLAGSRAFRRLFNYIRGENELGVNIPMTIPVISRVDPTCFPFGFLKKYTYSFYLPHEFWGNIPAPTSNKVFIEKFPATVFYVTRFGGYMFPRSVQHHLYYLRNSLDRSREPYIENYYITSAYDKPTKLFDRRNEIWIPMNTTEMNRPVCMGNYTSFSDSDIQHNNPQYEVLEILDDGIELRRYRNLRMVTKKAFSCDFETAKSQSFEAVEWYFKGYNTKQQQINRLIPVLFSVDRPQDLPNNCDAVYQTTLFAPNNGNLPESLNDSLSIEFVDTLDVFVGPFSGDSSDAFNKFKALHEVLESRCIEQSSYIIAGYNNFTSAKSINDEIWIKLAPDCQQRTTRVTTNQPEFSTTNDPTSLFVLANIPVQIEPIRRQNPVCGYGDNCLEYELVAKHGKLEQRFYDPATWVCINTTACGEFGQDIDSSTPYILKVNIDVLETVSCKKQYEMCTNVPNTAKQSTLKETNLSVKKERELIVYAYSFDGDATHRRVKIMAWKARQAASKHYDSRRRTTYLAQYNNPTDVQKRNEIWLV